MIRNSKDFTIEEAAILLNVTKKEVYRLLNEDTLSKNPTLGKIIISWESIHEYLINRHQKIPNGYISIAAAARNTGLGEYVIQCAIDRQELKTMKHRGGLIIEYDSFSKWAKFLTEENKIPLNLKEFLTGRIMVKNSKGLHTRPCCDLFRLSLRYQCKGTHLILVSGKIKAAGEKLIELLMLRSLYGDWLNYRIEGQLCDHLLFDLRKLFKKFEKYEKEQLDYSRYDSEAIKRDIEFSRSKR